MANDEMDAFRQAVEGLIQKAVEGFAILRERNAELAATLEVANKRLANYEESLVETIIDLERRNRQLTAECDAMRRKMTALQEALDAANARSSSPTEGIEALREPALHPENLYFLYGTPSAPTKDIDLAPSGEPERRHEPLATPSGAIPNAAEPTRPPSSAPGAGVDVFDQAYAALQAAFAELNRDAPAPPIGRAEPPLNESSLRPPAMEVASEPPRHVVLESASGDDRIVIPLPSASPPAAAPEARFGAAMPASPALAQGAQDLDLVVSPFDHFGTVTKFVDAVRRVPGVAHVAVRHFQDGALRLAVRYSGILPFTVHLSDMLPYRLRLINATATHIEATLETMGGPS